MRFRNDMAELDNILNKLKVRAKLGIKHTSSSERVSTVHRGNLWIHTNEYTVAPNSNLEFILVESTTSFESSKADSYIEYRYHMGSNITPELWNSKDFTQQEVKYLFLKIKNLKKNYM